MELSKLEINNLLSFRKWIDWLESSTPPRFLASLTAELKNQLVHMLEHFHPNTGSTINLYGGGALIVATNDFDKIIEQFTEIIHYSIKKVSFITTKNINPNGKFNLVIAHLMFSADENQIETGFSDSKKEKTILKKVKAHPRTKNLPDENFYRAISRFDKNFLDTADHDFIVNNIVLFFRCLDDINVKSDLQEQNEHPQNQCIALAHKRSSKTGFLVNIFNVLKFHRIKTDFVETVYIPEDFYDEKVLTHFYISPEKKNSLIGKNYSRVLESLSMVQWFEFENEYNVDFIQNDFSIHHTLFLRSVEEFVFQMLVNADEDVYTPETIHSAFISHPDITRNFMTYFSQRFNPKFHNLNLEQDTREETIKMIEKIDTGIAKINDCRKNIFNMSIIFIDHILKTNYYVIRRSALSYRVDPRVMSFIPGKEVEKRYPELPYGIFYIKGKNFIAFSIRFRDLARGGVRTLIPFGDEQQRHELKGVFRECYNLAYTQQKKNKDIPEGGSKSVIFIKPYKGMHRDLALEQDVITKGRSKEKLGDLLQDTKNTLVRRQLFDAQKSFCDTLLDILVWDDKQQKLKNPNIIDYYSKEELIFLGPDENMTNQMIDWISERSHVRNYRVGASFISGRQAAGINHKFYGVTSLGVHQYLLTALEVSGLIQEKEIHFKISGGPDGDVAGNEIINIINSFKKQAKIVCIQDGFGLVYDSNGIHHGELKRLFKETLGITEIKSEYLGPDAFSIHIRERREIKKGMIEVYTRQCSKSRNGKVKVQEKWIGASEANSYYHRFLHQCPSDVFLPCGGRPRSLNDNNWKNFLVEETPSAQIIVEGANLYLSDGARDELENLGVIIVKDASANKCGVICSSYEILSGLMVDAETFMSIKDELIEDILEILKRKALKEARLLLESTHEGIALNELSSLISDKINLFTDMMMEQLEDTSHNKALYAKLKKQVIEFHFPKLLRQKYSKKIQSLPEVYINAIIASNVASELIYQKGIEYQPSLFDALNAEISKGLFKK